MIKDSSKRKTMILAINSNGISHHKFLNGSSNTNEFIIFLNELQLKNITQKYILMDNVSFHHSKQVCLLLKELNLQPIYTSPYSPEWNPAEMFFSLYKRIHRSMNNIKMNIDNYFQEIIKKFPNDVYMKWYIHVFENIKNNHHI